MIWVVVLIARIINFACKFTHDAFSGHSGVLSVDQKGKDILIEHEY